jgi:DNA-binding MarR family transcriptional regulator
MMELEKEINQKKFRTPAHKLAVNLIYTYHWLNEYQVNLLKPFDLTLQQYNVLRILRGQHPLPASVKLIRERMLDKMSDASRIVEKLRLKELVSRNTSNDDRRACEVNISAKGLELLNRIDRGEKEFERYFSTLTEEEMVKVNELLDKLRG